jgi:peptidoglycan-associated lipoprotein
MRPHFSWIALIVLAVALAGCATTEEMNGQGAAGGPESGPPPADAGAAGTSGATGTGAEATGAAGAEEFQGNPLEDPSSPLSERVIYFDFDQSEIKPKYQDVLAAHGEYLATHPEKSVTVEGHTDERGSREYNLALGERRAQAVQKILLLNGAAGEQVDIVSYGEEKPADPGHNEQAWSQNRRAELVYSR